MAVALLLGSVSVTGNVAFAEDSPDSSVQIGDYYLSEDSKITDTTVTSTEKSYSDGMVKINKTIAGTDKENEFDITLKVQTGLEVATHTRGANVAVVLVIDSSTSMRDNMDPDKQRLYAAKQAAQNFVNAYADANASGNRFLSIVSYNTDAHVMQGWIDLGTSAGAAEVRNSGGYIKDQADYQSYYFSSPIYRDEKYWAPIAKIETQKGTNLDGGLLLAANLLQDNTTLSGVDNKVIILLSDGTPTTHVVEKVRGTY